MTTTTRDPTWGYNRMQSQSRSAVYIISVAAELAGVHPQTLRIYERKGLIEPYRTPGGRALRTTGRSTLATTITSTRLTTPTIPIES